MHTWRQRISRAALIVASAALSSACSSLDPCALYGCPSLDVRNGKDCREVFAVNRDRVAKSFSLRLRYRDGKPGALTEAFSAPGMVIDTHHTIGPGEELFLGCAPECWSEACWYEMFDAKDAALSREAR
jgi:hypothetical protein